MSKRRINNKLRSVRKKKGFIRPIHIQTLLVIIGYLLVSKFVFFKFVIGTDITEAFLGPFIFGVLTSFIFLYLFSHEDFFHFIKEVEEREEKKEGRYLKKYKHFGKMAAVMVIALIGGTIFAALTVRLLFANYKYRYLLLLVSMFFSTVFSLCLAKGVFSIL
ncbi:MAG TPA: hypothetical protein VMR19_04290 [Candidatus Saccharimonadales bacterium]|jgi:hypothetical protein|nr:hypothetical protein [Candidatus Saccharimonadales bacterium]